MRNVTLFLVALGVIITTAGCGGGQDPNVRRGDLFLETKKYSEAISAYEKAVEVKPELMEDDAFKEKFKNAYYYKGGQIELLAEDDLEILAGAYPYYVKGFDIWPREVGMCDKLVQHFWEKEDFKTAAGYLKYLVEFDAAIPETDENKWKNLHKDYYALGYALYKIRKYPEAKEALEQSLKSVKKGSRTTQAKSALEAVNQKLKKK